jgi:hypothetical protein
MPLTSGEKLQLQASVQTLADEVQALVVDPIPHPLQEQLDAANVQIAALTSQLESANASNAALLAERDAANALVATLQAKIADVKAAIQAEAAADAAEDAARANVLALLG